MIENNDFINNPDCYPDLKFNSNTNNNDLIDLNYIVNKNNIRKLLDKDESTDIFVSKKEKSSSEEWGSSIYTFNKNYSKLIPSAENHADSLIKSYFWLNPKKKLKKSKRIEFRRKRLSLNKIITSKPLIKHTSNKALITVYVYNRQKKIIDNKMKNSYKKTMLISNGLKKIDLRLKLETIIRSKTNKKLIIKYLPVIKSFSKRKKTNFSKKRKFNYNKKIKLNRIVTYQKRKRLDPNSPYFLPSKKKNRSYLSIDLSKVDLLPEISEQKNNQIFDTNNFSILPKNSNIENSLELDLTKYNLLSNKHVAIETTDTNKNYPRFSTSFPYKVNYLESKNKLNNLSNDFEKSNINNKITDNKRLSHELKKIYFLDKRSQKKLSSSNKRIIQNYKHIYHKIFIVGYDKLYDKYNLRSLKKKNGILLRYLKNKFLKKKTQLKSKTTTVANQNRNTYYINYTKLFNVPYKYSYFTNLSKYNKIIKNKFSVKPLFKTKIKYTIMFHTRKSEFFFNRINQYLKLNQTVNENSFNVFSKKNLITKYLNASNDKNDLWKQKYHTTLRAVKKIKLKYDIAAKYLDGDISKLNRHKKKHLKRYIRKAFSKETLYLYYKKLNIYNDNLFKQWKLYHLKTLLSSIYNKKVEFNFVNLKYLFLNSDIYTQSIALKLKNNRNKLLRVLKKALSLVYRPSVNKYARFYESHEINHNIIANKHNAFNINTQNMTTSGDNIDNSIHNIFLNNNDRFFYKVNSLSKNVLNSIKHKYIFGVRLEASGRLTKRRTASRSVFKVKYKGNLRDMSSLHRNLPSITFRGNNKSNVQYNIVSNKTRNGSFGLKGWVSSS